jgi:serine/threonine protein kinase/WD40 repeat protein
MPDSSSTKSEGTLGTRSAPPSLLADHELLRVVGQGSYGEVWLVRHKLLGTYRALKIVWRDTLGDKRHAQREFKAIQHFEPISRSHEGLVQILQVGELPGGFYYIMELADDRETGQQIDPDRYFPKTLHSAAESRLPLTTCIQIGLTLTDALSFLHDCKFLHRDIKPSNIIFVNGKAKLADIGLLALLGEAKSFVGTHGFCAPEGAVSPKSDIFSLGKLLYEITTGLHSGEFPELPEDITEEDTLLLEFNQIWLKCCDGNPKARYKSAKELKKDLLRLDAGKSLQKLRRIQRLLRLGSVVFAIFLGFLVAGFIAYAHGKALELQKAEALQRRLGTLLTKGTEKLSSGDYPGAWPFLLEAAFTDPKNQSTHELQLGSLQSQMLQIVTNWNSGPCLTEVGPSGKTLATSCGDELKWYDSASAAVLLKLPTDAEGVAISGDDHYLAYWLSNVVQVVDRAGSPGRTLKMREQVKAMAFAPNPETLAISMESGLTLLSGKEGTIELKRKEQVYRIVFSPSGKLVAVLTHSGMASVWNTVNGHLTACRPKHARIIYGGIFSPDERFIITCDFDGYARKWEIASGQESGSPLAHDRAITSIALSPDGEMIATGSHDRTVKLWTASEMQKLRQNHTIYAPERLEEVRFLNSSNLFFHCESGQNVIWSLKVPALPITLLPDPWNLPSKTNAQGPGFHFESDGTNVTGIYRGQHLSFNLGHHVECFALSPHRDLLAIGTREEGQHPESVWLFKTDGSNASRQLSHEDGITWVGFNKAGDKLLTCSEDFSAMLWDVSSGRVLAGPMLHRYQVRCAAFNRTEELIATAGWDGMVQIWEAKTGEPVTPPFDFDDALDFVQFTHDGKGIIAGTSNRGYSLPLPISPRKTWTSYSVSALVNLAKH